jgi:hypothetical protein
VHHGRRRKAIAVSRAVAAVAVAPFKIQVFAVLLLLKVAEKVFDDAAAFPRDHVSKVAPPPQAAVTTRKVGAAVAAAAATQAQKQAKGEKVQ